MFVVMLVVGTIATGGSAFLDFPIDLTTVLPADVSGRVQLRAVAKYPEGPARVLAPSIEVFASDTGVGRVLHPIDPCFGLRCLASARFGLVALVPGLDLCLNVVDARSVDPARPTATAGSI